MDTFFVVTPQDIIGLAFLVSLGVCFIVYGLASLWQFLFFKKKKNKNW